MKISDLKIGNYVVVNDLGAGKYSSGMRVIGRVVEIDDKGNYAIIESLPKHRYEITDFNDFELWTKEIEDKTESMGKTSIKWNENKNLELNDGHEIKVPDELLENPNSNLVNYVSDEIKKHQSNDLQQRKRKEKLVQWSDDIKLKFIERAIKNLSPLAAYHIGNAIDVLAVAESKEDIEQARWSLERAFENWDQ